MKAFIAIHKENLDINKRNGNNELPAVIVFAEDGTVMGNPHRVKLFHKDELVAVIATDHQGLLPIEGGLRAWVEVAENVMVGGTDNE